MTKPIICGLDSYRLLEYEKKLLAKHKPLGVILFQKNIQNKQQIIELIKEVKSILGEHALISIDQEGGRVQRIKEPICKNHPSAFNITQQALKKGVKNAIKMVFLHSYAIAKELKELGINMNFAPVADIYDKNSHSVIGDRAYSENPLLVSKLVNASARGFLRAGVIPVSKHIPGHGRTKVDTHETQSYINASLKELTETDFVPFINQSKDIKFSMVSHICYSSLDSKQPATTSATIVNNIIKNHIGFKGILISDCISMKALLGNLETKANNILNAGVDIVLSSWDSKQEKQNFFEGVKEIDANSETLQKIRQSLLLARQSQNKYYDNFLNIYYTHKENTLNELK